MFVFFFVFSFISAGVGISRFLSTIIAFLMHIYIFSNLQTQVTNDDYFFSQFDDAIIPDMLREMFVVNDSIHEVSFGFVLTFLAR